MNARPATAGLGEDINNTGALFIHSGLDAQADLVSVQLLAAKVAETRGLNPDKPRHLTRSVLLSDE